MNQNSNRCLHNCNSRTRKEMIYISTENFLLFIKPAAVPLPANVEFTKHCQDVFSILFFYTKTVCETYWFLYMDRMTKGEGTHNHPQPLSIIL